jgi:hypothetical protein
VRASASSILYIRHNCSSLLLLCYHPICIIAQVVFVTRHALLQGWLSPVRPGEHYLATYISTVVKPLPNPCMCSPPTIVTLFPRYASALWAVQATAAAQSGVLAASYRVALLNQ